jgi:CheY-like chemotaxis protein/PAS domain-containing protein
MATLQTRLVLALALVGGAPLAAKTAIELSRLEAPVAAEIGTRARASLLEAGPGVERAFAAGDRAGLERAVKGLAATPRLEQAAVVSGSGSLLAATSDELAGRAAEATPLAPAMRLASGGQSQGVRFATEQGAVFAALPVRLFHVDVDAGLTGPPPPAPPSAGFLLARLDLAGATQAARSSALRSNLALALALLALLIVAGVVVNASLAGPARRMAKAIERFDLGERAARTNLASADELGGIGRAFDMLAEHLQVHEADLLETKTRLEVVLKCVPVGVMVVRRDDGRPIYVNSRWKELFGIPMDATRDILSLLSTVRCERPDGSPFPLEQLPIPTALRTGRAVEERDLRVRRDDVVIALHAGAVPVSLWRDDTFDAVVAIVAEPGSAVVPRTPQRRDPAPQPSPGPQPSPAEPVEQALTAAAVEPLGLATLPMLERETEPATAEAATHPAPTVLVVEGEAALRDLAERALTEGGYRALVTGSASEAMTFIHGEGGALAAVVLDLWVPGTEGGALLDEMLALDPTLRVVAASGYRPDMPELAASGKVVAFLPKPYGADRLLATLGEATEIDERREIYAPLASGPPLTG